MFFKNQHGATVVCGACDYYDVYMIDIDEDRIELSDCYGMVIGTISVEQLNNCEYIEYDSDGRYSDDKIFNLGDLCDN